MLLAELLIKKKWLDKKVEELEALLLSSEDDDIASKLFVLLEERQNKILSIRAANDTSKLKLGDNSITVAQALIIKETLNKKINVITNLLEECPRKLDVLTLMEQREALIKDWTVLHVAVMNNDLNVTIGE
jgi:hypothetical protein